MTRIEALFNDKIRILNALLTCVKAYRNILAPDSESLKNADTQQKLDWVDELTSERESHFRLLQMVDGQIQDETLLMEPEVIQTLKSSEGFQAMVRQILDLGSEIQLTDQSLFLYISNIGYEIRSQILKGLKEKEAISKFKSQGQPISGDGLDQKA